MKKILKKENRAVLPLLILAGVLPWIICFSTEKISYAVFPWFPEQEIWADIFLAGKSTVLILLGIWMGAVLLYRWIRKKLQRPSKIWLPVLLLGILELASFACSKYPETGFFGMIEQYEPIGVLLAYLVIAFYAYEYIKCGGSLKPVILALCLSAAVLCVPGLTQLLQHDIWGTDPGKAVLIPESYGYLRNQLHLQSSDTERQLVYMTLYNSDYAGIFLAMLLPVLWSISSKAAKILAVILSVCLLGTGSGTAWLAAGMILIVVCLTKIRKPVLLVAGTLLIAGAIAWNVAGGGNRVEQEIPLEQVDAGEDAVYLTYAQQKIRLSYTIDEETGGVVQDIRYQDGTKVPVVWADDRGECDPTEKTLAGLHFKVYRKDDVNYVQFRCENVVFRFTDSLGTGKYEYVTIYGKVDDLTEADRAAAFDDRLLNGRGYIWNRVLPLLAERPLLGSGPDTFLLVFPQNDYVAKAKLGGEFFQQLITNAHDLYLQMAVQTGIPSVICLLLFSGIYLWDSWRIYKGRRLETGEERFGAAIVLAVTAYLICGLTWASSVCTTPFFWLFIGLGTALNEKNG